MEMFADATSLRAYMGVTGLNGEHSPQCVKFLQVFKNHMSDLDARIVEGGRLLKYLRDKVDDVFTGADSAVTLVDSKVMEVERDDSTGQDVFKYSALVDVHLLQDKTAISQYQDGDGDGNPKYTPSSVTLHDVKFNVELVPVLDDDVIKYNVTYTIPAQPLHTTFDKVVYKYNGRVKSKSLPNEIPVGGVELTSALSYSSSLI